jgi:guanylate kinase
VGKTSLVAEVAKRRPGVFVSVSATTRSPRYNEDDGRDYWFVPAAMFDLLVEEGAMLEHADYGGNRYGTPRKPVDEALESGRDVILEIELQGSRQVKAARPDTVTIFVEPPSWEVLSERLRGRSTEDAEALTARLSRAKEELAAAGEFDYRVVNEDLGKAAEDIVRIMSGTASRKDEPPA